MELAMCTYVCVSVCISVPYVDVSPDHDRVWSRRSKKLPPPVFMVYGIPYIPVLVYSISVCMNAVVTVEYAYHTLHR